MRSRRRSGSSRRASAPTRQRSPSQAMTRRPAHDSGLRGCASRQARGHRLDLLRRSEVWPQAFRTIAVCNVGDCDLHVSEVAFKRRSRHWRLVHNPFPATLHPGSCLNVVLRYTARQSEPRPCELVIRSNDPEHPVREVEVIAWTRCCCRECCDACREHRHCEEHHESCCAEHHRHCCHERGHGERGHEERCHEEHRHGEHGHTRTTARAAPSSAGVSTGRTSHSGVTRRTRKKTSNRISVASDQPLA